jgi:hypothetical protein
MFQNARKFNQELNWNTSKVTKMEHMFHGAEKFNQELNWNTSKVTNMEHMFHSAEKFNKELYWNTSKVTNMEHMFHSAENFNKELYWNTSKVIDMSSMFHNAEKFDNSLDWNTSEVTDMKHMFWGALSFNQKLKWDTSRVTDMSRMFQNAEKFDKELEWDTSNVTNMNRMFSGATNFTKKLKWDTLNVTIDAKMFEKTPFEKLMLGYNTQMVEWFNSLDTKIKEALTISCKWYSFRFDGYLNSIYRNTVYPYNKLKSHIATILEFRDILIRSHTLFENKMCNNGVTVKNPFENVMIENKISTPAYIEKVKDVTLYIHNTITQHFYTLTHSVTVYRGIVVRENDNISLNITGVTSVTLDLKIAIYFLDPIDEKDKCYLLEFDLPVGTKIVPMDICSFYDEKEYLVIDQGVLKIYKQKICNKKIEYNSVELPIVYINAEFVPNEELLIYTSFNCNI